MLVINARFVEIIRVNSAMSVIVNAVVADAVDMTGQYVPYFLLTMQSQFVCAHFKIYFYFLCVDNG